MKKIVLFSGLIIMAITLSACTNTKKQSVETGTTEIMKEIGQDEWISLFDGVDFKGWRGYNRTDIPAAWTIEDGAIKINGSGRGEAGSKAGGDIIYDKKFKNFELTFEWKVAKGANSGVFYLAREVEGEPIWKSSPEYQILDNANHPDAKLGKDNNRQSASLYDLIPAVPQNSKPFGEWNVGGIMVYKGTVVHSQNGENVLEYHLWTPEWEQMVEGSKFKGWENFINAGGENQEGYIGLQDHGDDVWYRNIKIKVLD
jgi:hypothetical protein